MMREREIWIGSDERERERDGLAMMRERERDGLAVMRERERENQLHEV